MDRKDRIQAVINRIIARAVVSSMIVLSLIFATLREVSTIKQRPSKVAEVLSICGVLFSGI
jgi:hypothetical protein